MRFRLQGPDFRKDITCGDIDTLGAFKQLLEAETGIPTFQIKIKAGVPPRTVAGNDGDSLNSVGIRSGDRLILSYNDIEEKPNQCVSRSQGESSKTNDMLDTGAYPECVPVGDGYLVKHLSISFYLKVIGSNQSAQSLRQLVVSEIIRNPEEYSQVVLGRSRDEYCSWIMEPNSWGGAIELAIFSSYFKLGEGKYSNRVIVLYSGIHYDAVKLVMSLNEPDLLEQTIFPVSDETVVMAASELARMLQEQHQYTDVANFTLRCSICDASLLGETDAQQHAGRTGHTAFEEYS
ncbi:ubiquitin-specific protease otu1 [Mycoemilia scoparia]|uniref:Ubiquitin thioesterase OTU n=1 Tax=Mycoemilia scoparia TaxID=417184 RepID=A0A9W8A0M0_9FUNG|nr:ubiquitin-specific protease otu1 [Mycoemilia scoparia]